MRHGRTTADKPAGVAAAAHCERRAAGEGCA